RETGRILLAAVVAHDLGLEAHAKGWGGLGARLVEDIVAGRRFSSLLEANMKLARPLVAIGRPPRPIIPKWRAGSAPSSPFQLTRRYATRWARSRE
ncbi:MAG TPA: hypothetical protein VKH13_04815, partial [Steroidobacteraceae bacterium]|nr:hypothetical protein [Steroidobacteraceae bacterium]